MPKTFKLEVDIDKLNVKSLKEELTKWNLSFTRVDCKNVLQENLRRFVEHKNFFYGFCEAGDFDEVDYLLKSSQVNINEIPNNGLSVGTPLTIAVTNGFIKIVELLLKNGADTSISSRKISPVGISYRSKTPLAIAVRHRNLRIIELLIDHGADLNLASGYNKESPLNIACSSFDHYDFPMDSFLKKTRNPELCKVATTEIVNLLLSRGALVNHASVQAPTGIVFDYTPLHEACRSKSLDVVKLLVENGANINAVDTFGQSPVHMVCYHNRNLCGMMPLFVNEEVLDFDDKITEPILRYLISKGADLNIQNRWNSWDSRFRYIEIDKRHSSCWRSGLTQNGEITALHNVCTSRMSRCLRILLDHGCRFSHLGIHKEGRHRYRPNYNQPREAFLCITRTERSKHKLCQSVSSFLTRHDSDIYNLLLVIHSCTSNLTAGDSSISRRCLAITEISRFIGSFLLIDNKFPSRLTDKDVTFLLYT